MTMKELAVLPAFHAELTSAHTCSSIGLMYSHSDKVCYLRDLSESSGAAFILRVKPQCSWQAQVTYRNVWMQNTCPFRRECRQIIFKLCCLFYISIKLLGKSELFNFKWLFAFAEWRTDTARASHENTFNKFMLDMKRSSSPSLFPDTALMSVEE